MLPVMSIRTITIMKPAGSTPRTERKALLKYMAEHNEHHAEELHELAHELSDDASAKVHEAVDLFAQGNALLREALKLLEKEEN